MKFRKCFVLKETQVDMKDLKKGDVFRLEKASPTDAVDQTEYSICESDASPCEPQGNSTVQTSKITFTKDLVRDIRF